MAQEGTTKTGALRMRPKARMLRTLGDELISSEKVAILELVKNAYDADATRVLIRFRGPLDAGKGSIEVIDNGHGMSMDTIKTAWMEPATVFKKRNTRSETKKRRFLGAKGIGRFAAAKLAQELEVVTRRIDADAETSAIFLWSEYENDQQYLDEIETLWQESVPKEICAGGTIRALWRSGEKVPQKDLKHGTILRMEKLHRAWDSRAIDELRIVLTRLISPITMHGETMHSDEFRVFLDLPEEYREFSGEVTPPAFFKNPPYSLLGWVDEEGHYELNIDIQGKQFELTGQYVGPENLTPKCGQFYFELRVWDREPQDLAELAASQGITVRQVRQDLDKVCGISIYRDKFRILPYGEPDNDWLRLDSRRVNTPTLRLSNNQIVGSVLLSADDNPLLKDQTNREGLVEGVALKDLREMLRTFIGELETLRYAERRREKAKLSGGERQLKLFADYDLTSVYKMIQERHPEDSALLQEVQRAGLQLDQQKEEVREVVARYHRLATLGQLYDSLLHESQTPLGKIVNEAEAIKESLHKPSPELDKLFERIDARTSKILNFSKILKNLFERIKPLGGRRQETPVDTCLEKVIRDACETLEAEISKAKIRLALPQSQTFLKVIPADIQLIIINLLRNSIYWLYRVSPENREIRIEVKQTASDEAEIQFLDSGPGVSVDISEAIFDPYVTTTPGGTGLGLTIVAETVSDSYDGSIALVQNKSLPGAAFCFTLHGRS